MKIWTRWAMGLFVFPMGALLFYSLATAPSRQSEPPPAPVPVSAPLIGPTSTPILDPTPVATIPIATPTSVVLLNQAEIIDRVYRDSKANRRKNDEIRRKAVRQQQSAQQGNSDALSELAPVREPARTLPDRSSPSSRPRPEKTSAPSAQAQGTQVWVNTKSGVFHYPGARWYGNTKNGTYMSESEALSSGYRAAENGQ